MSKESTALKITVEGVVQGVGFRPFIYNLAHSLGLTGYVRNTDTGVVIFIQGNNPQQFIHEMHKQLPPLAELKEVKAETTKTVHGLKDFSIQASEDRGGFTLISPDISVCNDCIQEMETPGDRRYLYPFINCTNCGPRYSITEKVPYDRPNTTMKSFRMCPECEKEYHDPSNRRFHAQPNACPECGPQVSLHIIPSKITPVDQGNAIPSAIQLLSKGAIVAIKGIGGFHIACDAENSDAVTRLRERKRRSNKPFALMTKDITSIEKYCIVTEKEKKLLLSPRRPIVLLRKQDRYNDAFPLISPGNSTIGFMLPYTPLHRLLFSHHGKGYRYLVMTSGNLSEEPIISSNEEALEKLSSIVDAFLFHNRDIYMAVDDSVAFLPEVHGGGSRAVFIRRARGYVPGAIQLHSEGPDVIGAGADLKNTFTITKGRYAIMSQHIGDMENYESMRFYKKILANLKNVFRVDPVAIGYDPHPVYMSNRWVLEQEDIKRIPVYHHYAHVASVVAEHGIPGKVIGVVFDGTGYGPDGSLWGGEFFSGDVTEMTRMGHLKQFPLPGGEASIKRPWKTAVSLINASTETGVTELLEKAGFFQWYEQQNISNILRLTENRELAPLSSGVGRIFDAVAAITGVCDENTFEAEAPIRLESIIDSEVHENYPFIITEGDPFRVDLSPAILSIIDDLVKGIPPSIISARFHNTVIAVILDGAVRIREMTGIREIALSGGVFQNRYILENSIRRLSELGFKVYTNMLIPANDACISLGQAFIVREELKKKNG